MPVRFCAFGIPNTVESEEELLWFVVWDEAAPKKDLIDFWVLCGCAFRVVGSDSFRAKSGEQQSLSKRSDMAIWSEKDGGVYIIPVCGVPN
jgi:hypothetical protein